MKTLNLSGTWKLRAEFIDVTPERFAEVAARMDGGEFSFIKGVKRRFPSKKGNIDAVVPCDVITPLVESGHLSEPLEKTNTNDCLWVKDYSWWFMRDFEVSCELLEYEEVRLFIEVLDYNAAIIINNMPVGIHKNSFRAFQTDVKRFLKEGLNQIIIRLTAGFEEFNPNDSIGYYCANGNGIADQRVYLRKPAYTLGWDWCKPVPTCGIGRKIELVGMSGAYISTFRADTKSIGTGYAEIDFQFEIENLSMCSADDAVLRMEITYSGEIVLQDNTELYLAGGINYITRKHTLKNVRYWWPNGYGDADLYTVNARVICRGTENKMEAKSIGIRTLELRQGKYADGTSEFRFVINDVPVFCKGGNWVPTDSVYLRTPLSTYRTLVEEAARMNCNMLRVWGGGLYEPDEFYEYCSENGILVMHDFMYACAYYPDYLPWFAYEAGLEAEYQVKRLASHCCMAVWTGNNEVHESYTDWFDDEQQASYLYGSKLFNYVFPGVVRSNSPMTPYMPSSPFFGDRACSLLAGDSHVWNYMRKDGEIGMKHPGDLSAFDRLAEKVRFSSEYGFHGPLMKSSITRFTHTCEISMDNPVWEHHGEHKGKHSFIVKRAAVHLVSEKTLEDIDSYLLYGGLSQGIMYADMSYALRCREHCSGSLIWMYNDCWPETGWTPIDYYLTRKISFYYLKRAYDSRVLIIRNDARNTVVTVINESNQSYDLDLEYGYFPFDGGLQPYETECISVEAHSVNTFTCKMNHAENLYVRQRNGNTFSPATNIRGYYRNLALEQPTLFVKESHKEDGDMIITVSSDVYCPIVRLIAEDDRTHFSDNYFELLPEIPKAVRVFGCDKFPEAWAVKIERIGV